MIPGVEPQPSRFGRMGTCGAAAAMAILLTAYSPFGSGAKTDSIPANLVIDLRLFESRSSNPNLTSFSDLSTFVNTDGRGVTANQWLATLANRAPGSLLAQLGYETIGVGEGRAHLGWRNGSRSFDVELNLDKYHPSGTFKARVGITFMREKQVLRTVTREVDLQLGRTSLWSGSDLELSLTDYISHFREYRGREGRGMLYEHLRSRRVHLILAATTRLRREEEIGQMTPETLTLPRGTKIPSFDNPYSVPLKGTVWVGFELDSEGKPINPQVIRSTLPEANPRILGESLDWRFSVFPKSSDDKMWGRVEVRLDIR